MGMRTPFLCLAACISLSAGDPPLSVILPIPFIPQQGKDLCWAASTQMVVNYVDPTHSLNLRQCGLVDTLTGTTNCCSLYPGGPGTWMTGQCNLLGEPPIERIHKPGTASPYQADYRPGKVPWNIAIAELAAGRPFIFSFTYLDSEFGVRGSEGHALVAYGYTNLWTNPVTGKMDTALVVWDPYGHRNEDLPAAGDAYLLSQESYDYDIDRFTSSWYGDGPSWAHVR